MREPARFAATAACSLVKEIGAAANEMVGYRAPCQTSKCLCRQAQDIAQHQHVLKSRNAERKNRSLGDERMGEYSQYMVAGTCTNAL